MSRSLDKFELFWKSGNYLLHKFKEGGDDVLDYCLIYDIAEDAHVKIEDMEDDTLGCSLKRRMMAEGVPIVRELPPGAGFFYGVVGKLLEADFPLDRTNELLEELSDMKQKRCDNQAILDRLGEMLLEASPQLHEQQP
jgi:hypothetical protein